MKQQFTINRHGVFTTSKSVRNQCKAPGHKMYDYTVKVTSGVQLDENGFVIDHNDIDKAVQMAVLTLESCEKICLVICDYLNVLFLGKGLKAKNIYVKVVPRTGHTTEPDLNPIAFMELETTL